MSDLAADEHLMALFVSGVDDPYPLYRRLREIAPVHRSERLGMTVLTGHSECRRVLTDDNGFPVVDREWMSASAPGWQPNPTEDLTYDGVLFTNPPRHTRLKRLMSRDFTSRRLTGLRPRVAAHVRSAFARLAVENGQVVDFQETVAAPLGVAVISDLLGVPRDGRTHFRQLIDDIIPFLTPQPDEASAAAVLARANAASIELTDYFVTLLAKRRSDPRGDLISAFAVSQEEAPDPLSDVELVRALIPIFGTAFTTVADAIGNGLEALLTHPDQFAKLTADPTLASSATTEILRYVTPYHLARRYARTEVELGGVTVPAGSVVMAVLAAANRDPDLVDEPERFDITRPAGKALPFGTGLHHCLGSALARMQLEMVCAEFAHFPGLRLAGPVVRRPSLFFHGPLELPVLVAA